MSEGRFEGFRTGGLAVTLPGQLFVEVLPGIEDEAELRVTVYAMYALGRTRGEPRAVRASRLASEEPLVRALARCGGAAAVALGLEAAARRGVLLACALEDGDTLYFVNNDGGRRQRERVLSGALEAPGGGRPRRVELAAAASRPAEVYEAEIGMLSPSVAAALAEAEERYPAEWIVDALREAAAQNARSWRYAEAILRRWESEGREDEATGRAVAAARDPYGHLVRRSYD
jgi:DNA replication protein